MNDNKKGHKQHKKDELIYIISPFFGRLCPKLITFRFSLISISSYINVVM